MTEWQPVPEWEWLYEVSDDGQIRRIGSDEQLKQKPGNLL